MTSTHRSMPVRALPGFMGMLLVLSAIIIGILGMHVLTAPHATSVTHATPTLGTHGAAATGTNPTLLVGGAHHADDALSAGIPESHVHPVEGCPDCDGPMCVAVACILFLTLASIAGILGLKSLRLFAGPGLRGPPRILPSLSLAPPTPSLVQLSISRT